MFFDKNYAAYKITEAFFMSFHLPGFCWSGKKSIGKDEAVDSVAFRQQQTKVAAKSAKLWKTPVSELELICKIPVLSHTLFIKLR